MDFSWNESEVELHERVLAFARTLGSSAMGSARQFPRDQWVKCGRFGLLGLCVPDEYGGMGYDALTTARVMEALGHGCIDMGFVFAVAAHNFACVAPIWEHGSEELKSRVLPRLCDGTWIGANAITEAEAGSDSFALQTRAVADGDTYVLSGVKSYVTNAPVADALLVYASTAPANGYLGVSAFLVERGSPGVQIGDAFDVIGLKTASISSVYLDQCRVPAANLIGGLGAGASVFKRSMSWERACLFAAYLGAMERQLDECIAYAKERRQFGKRIGRYQAISHRIADMKLRLDSARLLVYRACWLYDRGSDATLEIALAKIAVSEAAVQSGLDAVQIHGGLGVTTAANIECALRDAVPSTVFSGTSEVLRNLIVSQLGL